MKLFNSKFKNKMDKTKALKRLTALEAEAKQLRVIIETPDKPLNIMERVKTVEDACEVKGINYCEFIRGIEFLSEDTQAYEKLKIVISALRQQWIPNWKNKDEYKYIPVFKMDSFCFACVSLSFWHDYGRSSVASGRLCLPTIELAKYVGTQFVDLWESYFIGVDNDLD